MTRIFGFENEFSSMRNRQIHPRQFAPSAVLIVCCSALLFVLPTGCGPKGPKISQVSGRVTLDGKPLNKASITFAPMATKVNPNPGMTAQAITDDEGRYKLSIDASTPGAVVGTCRIYITTVDPSNPGGEDRDAGGPVRRRVDRVPAKYNMATELTFDVPPEGTDKANFDLTSN